MKYCRGMKRTVLGEFFMVTFHGFIKILEIRGDPICIFFVEYLTNDYIPLQVSTEWMGQRRHRHLSKVLFGMVIENLINCMSISVAAITYIYDISFSMHMQRCRCYLEKHFVVEMLVTRG